ncbi:MAG: c-type cytochrome [Chitinophagales bacterium]|jgi:mono/diheme cytochrome c family protein|nr:c-type cytochrome [Chitinophagales bacterium]
MTTFRRISRILLAGIFFLSISFANKVTAQDGKALFNANCASCHKMDKDLTGPALMGVHDRWNNDKLLALWIKNWNKAVASGDAYAVKIKDWSPSSMTVFEGTLSDAQIDAILGYIKAWKPEAKPTAAAAGAPAEEGDNTLLFGILTLILAVISFTLLQVNASLKKMADEKAGEPVVEPVPFWRNKAYIATLTVILFCVGGYLTSKGAMALGRSKDYTPTQPIFYSHKVHAGANQVNCLYCHGGAEQGKHANIPSVNVCMNCHKAINEYVKGPKLYDEEGNEVDGTAEIQKLYKYAGFDPANAAAWDPSKAKPIEWVKIHNLPDHVYFNHSQHVKAGKVACQTCHGEIQKMDEVKQFSDLSMGWCINCHRETKVQFKDNGFYSIYEKYHNDLKSGKIDSTKGITVEKIGGTECQKCHY